MSEHTEERAITFAGVTLSAEGVAVLDGDRVIRRVPREERQTIEVRSGFLSAHPLLQCALGGVLLWLGLISANYVVSCLLDGESIHYLNASLAVFLPAGVWVITDALKRGHHLRIESPGRRARIRLKGEAGDDDIRAFTERARSELGFDITFSG